MRLMFVVCGLMADDGLMDRIFCPTSIRTSTRDLTVPELNPLIETLYKNCTARAEARSNRINQSFHRCPQPYSLWQQQYYYVATTANCTTANTRTDRQHYERSSDAAEEDEDYDEPIQAG